MENEILKAAAELREADPNFKDKLTGFVNKAAQLMEPDPFFENSEEFKKITEFLGDYFSTKKLEAVLTFYNKKLNGLLTGDIPGVLIEAGLSEARLDNGVIVKLDKNVSVPKANIYNEPAFYIWLTEKGYADVIKNSLEFSAGEDIGEFEALLSEKGVTYKKVQGAHFQTLSKLFKDRVESLEGMNAKEAENFELFPPSDVAEVSIFNIAKIKQ